MAAIVATAVRWFIGIDESGPRLIALSIGFVVGITTVFVLQNAPMTCLLVLLLIGFAVTGLWLSGRVFSFAGGALLGGIVAFKGIDLINAVFRFCGLTISGDSSADRNRL